MALGEGVVERIGSFVEGTHGYCDLQWMDLGADPGSRDGADNQSGKGQRGSSQGVLFSMAQGWI